MWRGGQEIRATRRTLRALSVSRAASSSHRARKARRERLTVRTGLEMDRRMVFHRADDPRPIGVQDWLSTDSRFGLVRVGLSFPSYSPDGARVTGSENSLPAKRVFVMNAEGSERRVLYELRSPEPCGSEHLPDHQSPRLVTAGRSHRLLCWRPHGCARPDSPGADSPRRQ